MTVSCRCGAREVQRKAVVHHMPCAWVGPLDDFTPDGAGLICPKCRMTFAMPGRDSEVLGYCLRCPVCRAEWLEETDA